MSTVTVVPTYQLSHNQSSRLSSIHHSSFSLSSGDFTRGGRRLLGRRTFLAEE